MCPEKIRPWICLNAHWKISLSTKEQPLLSARHSTRYCPSTISSKQPNKHGLHQSPFSRCYNWVDRWANSPMVILFRAQEMRLSVGVYMPKSHALCMPSHAAAPTSLCVLANVLSLYNVTRYICDLDLWSVLMILECLVFWYVSLWK